MAHDDGDSVQVAANQSMEPYRWYADQRENLTGLARQLSSAAAAGGLNSQARELDDLAARIHLDRVRVAFVGDFKAGKSSLINAFLGTPALPVMPFPSTLLTTVVRWAPEPNARLHRTLPFSKTHEAEPLSISLAEVYQHLERTIEPTGSGSGEFTWAEIFLDIPLCRFGVEVVESAELERSIGAQRVTMEFLATADAVVFVTDVLHPISHDQLRAIDRVHTFMGDRFVVACNKRDTVPTEDEPAVREHLSQKISELVAGRQPHIVFVSARAALQGRKDNDRQLIMDSGIPELEESLASIMVRHVINERLRRFTNAISQQTVHLGQFLPTGQADFQQINAHIDRWLADEVTNIGEEVRRLGHEFYHSLAARISAIADQFTPTRPLLINPLRNRAQTEAATKEIAGYLGAKMEHELALWGRDALTPLLITRFEALEAGIAQDLRSLSVEMTTGLPELAAIDLALPDQFGVPVGSSARELASRCGMLGLATAVTTPIGVSTILLASSVVLAAWSKTMMDRLKASIVAETATALRSRSAAFGDDLAATVTRPLDSFRLSLHDRLLARARSDLMQDAPPAAALLEPTPEARSLSTAIEQANTQLMRIKEQVATYDYAHDSSEHR